MSALIMWDNSNLYLIADNDLRAISLINPIESLGGSVGYKKNPAAFKGALPATVSGKTRL
jgi:hypothetical protein